MMDLPVKVAKTGVVLGTVLITAGVVDKLKK